MKRASGCIQDKVRQAYPALLLYRNHNMHYPDRNLHDICGRRGDKALTSADTKVLEQTFLVNLWAGA
jgi:hypothetical protein